MRSVVVTVVGTLCLAAASFALQNARMLKATPEEEQTVSNLGREAAQKLTATLRQNLVAEMQKGGPAHAVDFCSLKALPLTSEVSALLQGLDVKRTTPLPRNPANAPDEFESQALSAYSAAPRESRPQAQVQKIQRGSEVVYRYYEPLYVASFCLTCHGSSIPADVEKIIQERYPEDRATGYRDGDFRGLIRVEIPENRLAP